MKASELIKKLVEAVGENGDEEVYTSQDSIYLDESNIGRNNSIEIKLN